MVSRRLLLSALAPLAASGCFGKFALVSKLHAWNGSLGSKVAQQFVFWAFLILPVYGACMFVDAVIFNLIEFWSGKNPLAELPHPDGSTTKLSRTSDGEVRLTRTQGERVLADVALSREGATAAQARSLVSAWTGSVERLPSGELVVHTDGAPRLVPLGEQAALAERAVRAAATAA